MKKSLLQLLTVIALILLLLRPDLSFRGASSGLLLWFDTVLPTLLPFMICSNAIVLSGAVPVITKPIRRFLKPLSLTSPGVYALLCGLLCGYPMGPKTAADFLTRRELSPAEARFLLAVSAWPSPMFLFGYVKNLLPPSVSFPLLLLCVYLPLIPLSAMAAFFYRPGADRNIFSQEQAFSSPSPEKALPLSFDSMMMSCLEIMAKIGGYLMIFSILAAFLKELSLPWLPWLLGLVEMTTGIRELSLADSSTAAAAGILGAAVFGGASGVFQVQAVIGKTSSMTKNAGLSIRHYVLWKLLHLAFSTGLFILLASLR